MSSTGKGRRSPNGNSNSRGTTPLNNSRNTPLNTPPESHASSWFYDDVSPFPYDLRWNFSPKTPEKSLLDLLSSCKSPLQFFSPGKSPFAGLSPSNSPLVQKSPTASRVALLSPETLSLLDPVGARRSSPQLLLSPSLSSPVHITVPAGVDRNNVPTTAEEIDEFLASAWNNEEPTSSEYSSKLSDLFQFYTSKLTEIDTAERRSLADNLPDGSQAGSSLNSIDDCFKDAQIRGHYDAARKRLKEETVQSIFRLRVKSPARPNTSINSRACRSKSPQMNNSSATEHGRKSLHKKSPAKGRKLQTDRKPLDTDSILDQWFEEHSERPYPNKKQKEDLAKHCNITIKQVTTWFNNKRYRSNCTKTKKGKGKK
ncbi:uncharacterized protein [Dysidea avara]|uniref:uncharacterized protein n=1 Tax=Dysidea avara TaxID=196820 RepID=UPI00331D7E50